MCFSVGSNALPLDQMFAAGYASPPLPCFLVCSCPPTPPQERGCRRRAQGAVELAAAAFNSSVAVLSKSTPRIRFSVREKRADAKSALKKILLNGGPCQESSDKQMRKEKGSGKSKGQHSFPGKNRQSKNKCKL